MDVLDCLHYERKCVILAPCCSRYYPCRLCHDDHETHQINRFDIKQIKCKECGLEQQVQPTCSRCGVVFGQYFCAVCNFFDNNVTKKQFHCRGCGICRVGGQENFFHCDVCNLCLSVEQKDNHKCIQDTAKSNCPVCMEYMQSSTKSLSILKCRHALHQECYQQCLKSGLYACPVCGRSTVDMEESWKHLDLEIENMPMPDDYKNIKKFVLCRDCHKVTETLYHVLGMKCQSCGSYNTADSSNPVSSIEPQT